MEDLIELFNKAALAGQYKYEDHPIWGRIKGIFTGLFGTEVNDEEGALKTLEKTIEVAIKNVEATAFEISKLKSQAQQLANQQKSELSATSNKPATPTTAPPAKPVAPANPVAPKMEISLKD